MKFRIFTLQNFALIFFLSIIFFPGNNYCQNKYDFNFDSDWTWEDLSEKVVLVNPQLLKSVEYLKNKITLYDTRILFRYLSLLDSLNGVKAIKALNEDREIDSIFSRLDSLYFVEDFGGLVTLADALAQIRVSNNKNLLRFDDREYLYQPIKDYKKNFDISFDYKPAEYILDYYKETELINDLLSSDYQKLILKNSAESEIGKEEFSNSIRNSARFDKINSIYKWVFPGSYFNLGGVSIYKDKIRDVINSIKINESNIKSDIINNVSDYLPDSIFFNINVLFRFGKNTPGWTYGRNNAIINLEYFGNDYNYLIRFIKYLAYKIAYKEIRLPVDMLIVNKADKNLIELLSNIFENGTANYISPVGTETRPWYLLEKDFKLFNKTFANYYKKNNKKKLDSLIQIGYSGDAPFYTMATQMAYIIEATLGRNELIEAVQMGPVAFFGKFIKAYKDFPDRIRTVFTFNEKFEKKIIELGNLFPPGIIKDALKLKKNREDTTFLNRKISDFIKKYSEGNTKALVYFLSGQLMLESGMFNSAKYFYQKGFDNNKKNNFDRCDAGNIFYEAGAGTEALYFYNQCVNNSGVKEKAYALERRGEFFYMTGDLNNARNDFEEALVINPESKEIKKFLEKIELKK